MREKIQQLAAIFSLMPEWTDRYNYLVDLAAQLPPMPVAFKTPGNRITCNSMLYFYVYEKEAICYIEAEANTAIPAGLAALLWSVCNECHRSELTGNLPFLIQTLTELGLPDHLTPQRSEALAQMLGKLK